MAEESRLHILPRDIYVPAREVVKLGRDRWIIYLPRDFNDVWEEIKRRGLKVRIYIQLVEGRHG
ncbi:MAG: hypothetical protein QXT64_01450 [Desulfurococcaceae archaeon]